MEAQQTVDEWTAAPSGRAPAPAGVLPSTKQATPAKPGSDKTPAATVRDNGRWSDFVSTLALTLTNPMTIVMFAAVFAGLGAGANARSYIAASLVVAGVFSGSALWWLLLSGGVSLLRRQIDAPKMMPINKISGIIISAFGVLAVVSALSSRLGT